MSKNKQIFNGMQNCLVLYDMLQADTTGLLAVKDARDSLSAAYANN